MISNTPEPPELSIAKLFRLLHEGRGTDDLLALVEEAIASGWPPIQERAIQDALRFRLNQLLRKAVDADETREFIFLLSAAIDDSVSSNPALAERLDGLRLIARDIIRRPGHIPAQDLLADPFTQRILTYLATATDEERSTDALEERFGDSGDLDSVLWPLLNLNHLVAHELDGIVVYSLGDELRGVFGVSPGENEIASLVQVGLEDLPVIVPVQPIFDFLLPLYASECGIEENLGITIKAQHAHRLDRNWFSIDDFYFEPKGIRSEAELRMAILPRKSFSPDAAANSIDLMPTNTYVGFHWLISRTAVQNVPRDIVGVLNTQGDLRPLVKTRDQFFQFIGQRTLRVLIDRPMEDHARHVLSEVAQGLDYEIELVEDNASRLEQLSQSNAGELVVAIATGPMLATAMSGPYLLLTSFEAVAREFQKLGAPFDSFAGTLFHQFLHVNIRRDEWSIDQEFRDITYRLVTMMNRTVQSIANDPRPFATYLSRQWSSQRKSQRAGDQVYADLLTANIEAALKVCYVWLAEPNRLISEFESSWVEGGDLYRQAFWNRSASEGTFFPTILKTMEEERAYALVELDQCLSLIAKKRGAEMATRVERRARDFIQSGAINFVRERLRTIGARLSSGDP